MTKGETTMRNWNFLSLLLILGLLGSGFAFDAHAGGVVTDCTQFGGQNFPGSLGAALIGGGDVTFACDGTITVVPQIQILANTRIDATGRAVTLSGGNTNSVFWIRAGYTLDLISLTITGGAFYGGVRNLGGTVNLDNCVISYNTNTFTQGGGIRNENWSPSNSVGTMTLTNTTVSDNNAAVAGGIYNAGNMTLTDSTVTRNNATSTPSPGTAGAIYNLAGSITLINSDVLDNTADSVAGIYNSSGQLAILNSTMARNTSDVSSGAIVNDGGSVTITSSAVSDNTGNQGGAISSIGGTISIENSTVSNNHSTLAGGAIRTGTGATLTITNSTLSGNSTDDRGGAIFSFGGQVTITNSTLSGNSASQGGGIYNYAPLSLIHVTFSGNSGSGSSLYVMTGIQISNTLINGQTIGNCEGFPNLIADGGYNLANDGTCNLTSSTSLPNTIPLLDVLANNGGITETHALLEGSPAIDRIPPGTNGCGSSITADQRGVVRPQGEGCDIGAYERVVVVDSQPPVVSQVQAVPNPARANTNITLTARIDDTTTGGSIIVSAEYNVDGGNWIPMNAVDGQFDNSAEAVTATLVFTSQYGSHAICVRGTDGSGNVSPETCTAVMIEPDTNAIHVEDISGAIKTSRKSSTLTATVQVLDQNGAAIQGVVVNIQLTNPADGGVVSTLKARTGRTGVATFKPTSTIPSWRVCVTDLIKSGYIYDALANRETCDTYFNYLPTGQTAE